MLMLAGDNFIGNAANFKQRGLTFRLGDKRTDALQTHQQPLVSKLTQRPINSHTAKTILRDQLRFRRDAIVRLPDTAGNLFTDLLFYLFVKVPGQNGSGMGACVSLPYAEK